MTRRTRVAKVRTLETAWKLVGYLHEFQAPCEQRLKFMVVLPAPDQVEVWPAVGSPLRAADWVEVDGLVARFKKDAGSSQ